MMVRITALMISLCLGGVAKAEDACSRRDPVYLVARYIDDVCQKESTELCIQATSDLATLYQSVEVMDLYEPDMLRIYIYMPVGGIAPSEDGFQIIVTHGSSGVYVQFDKESCDVIERYWDR